MLGWKEAIRDAGDFLTRWTLWEASAKCVGGSVLKRENPDFERMCRASSPGQLSRSESWAGLVDRVDDDALYAVALHGQLDGDLIRRDLDAGSIQAW
jgi:hypothetical protein